MRRSAVVRRAVLSCPAAASRRAAGGPAYRVGRSGYGQLDRSDDQSFRPLSSPECRDNRNNRTAAGSIEVDSIEFVRLQEDASIGGDPGGYMGAIMRSSTTPIHSGNKGRGADTRRTLADDYSAAGTGVNDEDGSDTAGGFTNDTAHLETMYDTVAPRVALGLDIL